MPDDSDLTIHLPGELGLFVREETARRGLASADELVEQMLRDLLRDARLAALEDALARGIADADAGRVVPLDEGFDRARRTLDPDRLSARG